MKVSERSAVLSWRMPAIMPWRAAFQLRKKDTFLYLHRQVVNSVLVVAIGRGREKLKFSRSVNRRHLSEAVLSIGDLSELYR